MSSPVQQWSDRRGLFQKGKELHEPGRRLSNSGGASGAVADAVRRASVSSTNSMEKTLTNRTDNPSSPANDTTTQRRRSSAASQGLFANLSSMKRGSESYGERRASHSEMVGSQGVMSGWWNSTFRGMQKPQDGANIQAKNDNRRGVME